jgi:hypothetical protein
MTALQFQVKILYVLFRDMEINFVFQPDILLIICLADHFKNSLGLRGCNADNRLTYSNQVLHG